MKKLILFFLFITLITTAIVVLVQGALAYHHQQQAIRASQMEITFLDIGQGDATYIRFPNGSDMLVDCAIDARVLEALGGAMPFYDRRIDILVVTHPDLDHYGGCIDVMERFEIGQIWYNGYEKETDIHQVFLETMEKEPAELVIVDTRTKTKVGVVDIDILFPNLPVTTTYESFPAGSNNSSIVLKLTYGQNDVLLPGDIEEEAEQYLIDVYGEELDVELLKAGHHGSDSSSKEPFLAITSPDHVVASAGKNNRYGHPHREVIERVQNIGATMWRTDEMGDIRFVVRTSSLFFDGR